VTAYRDSVSFLGLHWILRGLLLVLYAYPRFVVCLFGRLFVWARSCSSAYLFLRYSLFGPFPSWSPFVDLTQESLMYIDMYNYLTCALISSLCGSVQSLDTT
jgi:hypothetical protein